VTTLLALNGLGRRFGGLAAVHDVSIELATGTRHALIGPNGAGKTTLVNLIAGTLRPTSGTIVFNGHDITRQSGPARARLGIGRTWQHPAVFGRLTVTANLLLALNPRHEAARSRLRRRATLHTQAEQAVHDAGLAAHATDPAAQLPYGLQRTLELAMALAARPQLLLLDEPSAGLDPDEITRLTQLLTTHTADLTVLLVDHNLDLVWTLADTVTVLHHGRHLATASPGAIRADPQVQAAYLTTTDQPPIRPQRSATPAGPALLQVRQLRAGYRGASVLHGIDLDVHEGEAVAVLGRNGAGKTTLLNTIAGLLPAGRGSHVELAGRSLVGRRPHHPSRAGLALVPQGRRLFGPLTVAEHLTCAVAAHRGARRASAGPAWTVEGILTLLPPLAARLRHPAQQLSGGEQQMLALARALLTQPQLLVLDEPSEGLAPAVIDQLATTLDTLTADGLAVLIAEQNLALAAAVTDRVVMLTGGRIALTAPTHQLSGHTQPHIQTLLGVADPALTPHREARP
jgi:branched-chain amino acid transport system ATP-binding protein